MRQLLIGLFSLYLGIGTVQAQTLTLLNAQVIDGTGKAPFGATVILQNGKITAVQPPDSATQGKTLDLQGRYLTPGFIDAHAHFITPEAAGRALRSGVTTARILGDTYLQALGLRDLIRQGYWEGPEMLVSGGHIRPRLGTAFIVSYPQFGQYLDQELRGPAQVALVTRAVLAKNVDVIKVGASERAGRADTDPRRQELTEDEIRAAVAEAKKAGKFVAAHVHDAKGGLAAVRAGVRSVEHGTYLTEETLQLMKTQGTFLVPTLAVMSPLGDPEGNGAAAIDLGIRTHHMQSAIRAMVRRAKALGITVAAATDGTYGANEETAGIRIPHDLAIMVECGYSPLEAIRNGTQNGAKVLGIEQRTGTIQVDKEADLLVFDRNPLTDLTVLFEPLVVINNGKIVVNRIY